MKLPRLEYLLASGPLWKVGFEMFFEGVTAQEWWGNLPWSHVFTFSAGLFLALFFNDLRERKSWVWVNYRALFSKFTVEGISAATRDDPRRLELVVTIRPRKRLKAAKFDVFVTPLFGPETGKRTFAFSSPFDKLEKDQLHKVVIASSPISFEGWTPSNPKWGDTSAKEVFSEYGPVKNGGYLAEVRMGKWFDRFQFTFGTSTEDHQFVQYFGDGDAERLLQE